jgi:hypothetical protein
MLTEADNGSSNMSVRNDKDTFMTPYVDQRYSQGRGSPHTSAGKSFGIVPLSEYSSSFSESCHGRNNFSHTCDQECEFLGGHQDVDEQQDTRGASRQSGPECIDRSCNNHIQMHRSDLTRDFGTDIHNNHTMQHCSTLDIDKIIKNLSNSKTGYNGAPEPDRSPSRAGVRAAFRACAVPAVLSESARKTCAPNARMRHGFLDGLKLRDYARSAFRHVGAGKLRGGMVYTQKDRGTCLWKRALRALIVDGCGEGAERTCLEMMVARVRESAAPRIRSALDRKNARAAWHAGNSDGDDD